MGKNFRSGGIAAPAPRAGVATLESATRRLHEGLATGGFERDAFARLCRLNAPRLLGAVAQRLEHDALPCDGHDVLVSAMARLRQHYLRRGAADADSALLASIGGARSWFAAVAALALRLVDARSRWMGAASLPLPVPPPPERTPARLAGRRLRLEPEGLRRWIGSLLLSLPPLDRRLVLRARRVLAPADSRARLRAAADRLYAEVDRIVAPVAPDRAARDDAAPALALAGVAGGEARDG